MSDASTPAEAFGGPTGLRGTVSRQWLAMGTKSQHQGMVLTADDGTVWPLRRVGANPFRDPMLEALDGLRAEMHGQARNGTLFVERWVVLNP
jgi:hypothetical protein